MRILVIGATRGTGQHVMQQALAAGYTVTTLARDPSRLDVQHDRLSMVRGDVLDPATLAPAMAGQDAVISSIGVTARGPTTLYSDGMRNIIQAMHATGVKRLVAVSAWPLSSDDGNTLPARLLLKPLIWALLRPVYADMARMEDEMRQSGLDWTIVRPGLPISRPPAAIARPATAACGGATSLPAPTWPRPSSRCSTILLRSAPLSASATEWVYSRGVTYPPRLPWAATA
jgi:putative NADH-flavin reductase